MPGVLVSVTGVPVKPRAHVEPHDTCGLEVSVPVLSCLSTVWLTRVNVAVTLAASITMQAPVPVHAPPARERRPDAGVLVSVTGVP